MKKGHIVLIILIAVAIGAIVGSISDSSTYADFDEAFSNQEREFHVVGTLNKEKPTIYNPQENADLFRFHMLDNNGVEKEIFLQKAKPQDFERSEQIVLIGQAKNDVFVAREILMKCPSKYEDGSPEETISNATL